MFDFKLTKDGRTERFESDTRDILVWERTNRRRRTLNDLSKPSMADLYEVAATAAKRLGLDLGDVETWVVDLEREDAGPDPTRPAA